MPQQISRDLKTVRSPLLITNGLMDGWFWAHWHSAYGRGMVAVPFFIYYTTRQRQTTMRSDDFVTIGGIEMVFLVSLIVIITKRGAQCRLRRFAAGQRIHCGYNVTATPERCPECGKKPYPD